MNLTVVYLTSNQEEPEFEAKIQQSLCKAIKGLPLISVSHKPMKFGRNFYTPKPVSSRSILEQALWGAEQADTEFVSFVMSDCLYHKSYFDFIPKANIHYRPDWLYVVWTKYPAYYWRKREMHIHGFSGRVHIIDVLKNMLKSVPHTNLAMWTKTEIFNPYVPVVSFKTGRGMHMKSPISKKRRVPELPYWGKARDLVNGFVGTYPKPE